MRARRRAGRSTATRDGLPIGRQVPGSGGAGLALLLGLAMAAPAPAVLAPDRPPDVSAFEVRDPRLSVRPASLRVGELPPRSAAAARRELEALGVESGHARLDLRTGRWGTLILSRPLIPGSGVGNRLTSGEWLGEAGARAGSPATESGIWERFVDFLRLHAAELRLDPAEMPRPGRVTIPRGGELVQIFAPRVLAGVPVRDSYVTAVVNHGNLVLLGARNWGDPRRAPEARLGVEEAFAVVRAHLGDRAGEPWGRTTLERVPLAVGETLAEFEPGHGLELRPVWALRLRVVDAPGRWEALVDAVTGEILAFEDTNHYATPRRVQGGVYPVSNDGAPPDGVEQAGWPMPFDRVATEQGEVATDTGGNLPSPVDGTIASSLDGAYVRMNDTCGAIDLVSEGDLDFGVSGGDDCTTPGFGGPGNTHSSRTGFYALNRILEQARSHLPGNPWLGAQLTAEVNIDLSCAAFWNGETLNFSRSGGGCANPGEVAAIYDHEWGHGLDDNDAVPTISNPSEGIADLYSALHLDTSCIGRSFLPGNCGGYGDPCVACTGVRDIDWERRLSGEPHDLDWIDANCTPGTGPCGGVVHCESAVASEAVWDLVKRTLPAPPFSFDADTALVAATYLTYLGGGGVGAWYQCTAPFGGCNADGGYLNYLAADDDNGDLTDGTPHMSAIFRAFDLHQIACDSP